jgi:hypothetical protein
MHLYKMHVVTCTMEMFVITFGTKLNLPRYTYTNITNRQVARYPSTTTGATIIVLHQLLRLPSTCYKVHFTPLNNSLYPFNPLNKI